ncbi:MAG: SulP family inorganic anion transporter [Candidatus Krumholzibacteriia bacterium]
MRIWPADLEPKLVTVLREGYSARQLGRDAVAGLIVGVVALPLAIAFAIASGVRPEQGLYTAVVAGFLISALGGSRVQIGGPTGAFVVLVASVVGRFGYDGLALATLLAGVLLVVMALARLGAVIRFIPYPVTVGFTTGIAVIIAAGQVVDGLALPLSAVPAEFIPRCAAIGGHLAETDPNALALALFTMAMIWLWPRLKTPIPAPLVALVAATLLVRALGLDIETIDSRFGSVPSGLPTLRLPHVDLRLLPALLPSALSIAMLAGIESLLSALVADGMIGGRHRSSAELLGQGIANLASPFFGGIPATGAIARTATNVKSGGRTPFAGIVHALTLLAILVAGGRWAGMIPLPALAGFLVVIAYNMSEWRVFLRLFRGPRSDVLVLLTTFLLTVLVDINAAIQAGVVLAALLLMRRMAEVSAVKPVTGVLDYEGDVEGPTLGRPLPQGVDVFEVNGSFCFGAAGKFTEVLANLKSRPRVVILRMRSVLAMDATGLHALEGVASRLRQQHVVLLLSGVHLQPLSAMERSGTLQRLGREHLFDSYEQALDAAALLVGEDADPAAGGRHGQ